MENEVKPAALATRRIAVALSDPVASACRSSKTQSSIVRRPEMRSNCTSDDAGAERRARVEFVMVAVAAPDTHTVRGSRAALGAPEATPENVVL